jgi:D-glycero-alpha-D-manno-heptose-7-phosphate kinase
MIIVRTPLRVSFFGGGTDHPTWFNTGEPAAVLSTTIDKYIYVTLRRLPQIFDFNYRVAWRIIEETKTLSEIQHPIVRAVLENYGENDDCGYEVLYNADLPAQSGLGSSSAFTVSMLKAYMANLHRLESKQYYAEQAIRIEQDLLKEPVGSQDQVAAAYGGLNQIDFYAGGQFKVEPICLSKDRRTALNSRLMMFFTGFTRSASKIEGEKIQGFVDRTAELRSMHAMVSEGRAILESPNSDLADFGRLLHEGWQQKRRLSQGVSNAGLDDAYEAARKAGAIGGKLLGAGGGGFLLFYVEPEHQDAVREALKPMIYMPFGFESSGSSVVLYNPDLTSNYDAAKRSQ